jgi:hypothetical protein
MTKTNEQRAVSVEKQIRRKLSYSEQCTRAIAEWLAKQEAK